MINSKLKILFIAIIFFGFFGVAKSSMAAVYYVDGANPLASDSNIGSEASPWKTVQKAANTLVAGDTAYVKAGTYSERVVTKYSGGANNLITFKSSSRRSVTISGFDIAHDYIKVEGFEITNDLVNSGVTITGNNTEIIDNYIYNIHNPGIMGSWTAKPQSAHIANNHIYHSRAGIYVEGDNWLIENNEIERLYDYTGADCDYFVFFGENHVFRNNYLHGTILSEIGAAHVDCWQSYDSSTTLRYAKNILVEQNTCLNFHQGFMGEAHNYHNTDHLIFRNNIFAHGLADRNDGMNIQDIPYVTVENNVFADLNLIDFNTFGVLISAHDSGLSVNETVINNIFYNSGMGYKFNTTDGNIGDYNLIYPNDSSSQRGAHDIVGDPLFSSYSTDDFHLQAVSPAVNAGSNLGTFFTNDRDGTTRPQGAAWDIGAYEYVSSDTIPPAAPSGLSVS